jgi:hypothetical protein
MLSRDCDACGQMHLCQIRYKKVGLWEKVSCPDGVQHLIDCEVQLIC